MLAFHFLEQKCKRFFSETVFQGYNGIDQVETYYKKTQDDRECKRFFNGKLHRLNIKFFFHSGSIGDSDRDLKINRKKRGTG
jgi:hypothetical protein